MNKLTIYKDIEKYVYHIGELNLTLHLYDWFEVENAIHRYGYDSIDIMIIENKKIKAKRFFRFEDVLDWRLYYNQDFYTTFKYANEAIRFLWYVEVTE